MKLAESEELYELSGKDALIWLEKAQGLRYCAEILKDKFVEMVNNTPPGLRRVETNSLFGSTLLLLGLAFENLIKGVYVARDPNLVNRKQINLSLWGKADSGHGITRLAKSLTKIESDEEELLGRLQEYIFGAGRFPIPPKSSRYHEGRVPVNKHRFSTSDFDTADRLFEKLKEQLIQNRTSNPPL